MEDYTDQNAAIGNPGTLGDLRVWDIDWNRVYEPYTSDPAPILGWEYNAQDGTERAEYTPTSIRTRFIPNDREVTVHLNTYNPYPVYQYQTQTSAGQNIDPSAIEEAIRVTQAIRGVTNIYAAWRALESVSEKFPDIADKYFGIKGEGTNRRRGFKGVID